MEEGDKHKLITIFLGMCAGLIGFIVAGLQGMFMFYIAYFCFVLIAWAYKKSYET